LKEIKVQQFKFSQDLYPLHHHLLEELKNTILYPLIDLNQVLFVKMPGARSGALSDRAQPTEQAHGRSSQVVGMMYQESLAGAAS
jgi:hypothetical protein